MADTTTTTELSKRDRAIAAWESAVARTLNPHLSAKTADRLWDAVLENRTARDADAFAAKIADVLDGAQSPVRRAADVLVANLIEVLAIKE